MNYKKEYLKYKKLYLELKNQFINQKGSGISNSAIFLMTDIPNIDGTQVRHVLLLVNRKMESGKLAGLKYSLPGGKVDHKENYFAAMKREYKEETGYELPKISSYINNGNFAKMDYNDHTRIYISTCSSEEIVYVPKAVKNKETCGLILYPCEQLKKQLNGNPDEDYFQILLRKCQVESTKKIFNDYLDDRFNIKKSD